MLMKFNRKSEIERWLWRPRHG